MNPAIILENFDNELFVLPISSKKPKKYKELEDYYNKKTLEEYEKKKEQIIEIVQIDNI